MSGSLGYNNRLFSGKGLRSFIHTSRFTWTREAAIRGSADLSRVIELGCFDGRLLGYLPSEPVFYAGLDAGWEGGLAAAQARFADRTDRKFIHATCPSALTEFADKSFTTAFALETIEHIPADLVDSYLRELARIVEGQLFVTVPNEKGLVFIAKWLAKEAIYRDGEKYAAFEVMAATLGRMDKIERNQHKGFDYRALARQISRYFDDVRLHGIPFGVLPAALSITIGITAHSRH